MYDGIKKATVPVQKTTSSIKLSNGEILTDNNELMEKWVKHYSNLYSRQNTVSQNVLDSLECLQTMDELDAIPSIDELNIAIVHLTNGKAPGSDQDMQVCPATTTVRNSLSMLTGKGSHTGNARCQNNHSVLEQRRMN